MPASLEEQASRFARELSDLSSAFIGRTLPFSSSILEDKVSITPDEPLPVRLAGQILFAISVEYRCVFDRSGEYLRIDESRIKVFAGERTKGDPLFRYEYVNDQRSELPCAHLQVHAHRDQLMMAMAIAAHSGTHRRKNLFTGFPQTAQMSRLHFPLGGPRFRPGLEDVLQMLHTEFGTEVGPTWPEQLERARSQYRRTQTAAVIRDCPSEAVRVLTDLGYTITPPDDGPAPDRAERLAAF